MDPFSDGRPWTYIPRIFLEHSDPAVLDQMELYVITLPSPARVLTTLQRVDKDLDSAAGMVLPVLSTPRLESLAMRRYQTLPMHVTFYANAVAE